jgi:hypothetical protein
MPIPRSDRESFDPNEADTNELSTEVAKDGYENPPTNEPAAA